MSEVVTNRGTFCCRELEERSKCKFSPSSRIETLTVTAKMADLPCRQKNKTQVMEELPSFLTIFNAGGAKPPLFFVHGNRGFTLYHKSFLDGFDRDQPIGFLESPGLDGKEPSPATIVAYAERYLEAICKVAPGGNWQIASNCAGGLIALEMCLLAEKRGDQVSRLMMIDPINGLRVTAGPGRRSRKGAGRLSKYQRIKIRCMQFFSFLPIRRADKDEAASPASADENIAQSHRTYDRLINRRLENLQSTVVPSRIAYHPEAMQKVSDKLEELYEAYILQGTWRGNAFILCSRSRVTGLNVWKSRLPNVLCRVVCHNHKELFREGLPDVWKFLRDAMMAYPKEPFQP